MQSRSTTRLHIAIDLDDVVLDFFPGVLASFEKEFGEKVEFDGRPWGPDADAFYKHPLLLAAGYSSWWDWLRDREWLWANFGVVHGAIGGIQTLRHRGHYLECVTSKPDWAEHNVWKWLGKWRPAFQRVTIVDKATRKVDVTEADVLVDDKPDNVKEFIEAGRRGILFDRSYVQGNFQTACFLGCGWAGNWSDVVRQVEGIAND